MQVAHPGEVLLSAVVLETLLPELDRRVDPAEPQRDITLLLRDPCPVRGVERV
jgi:hypothetical protein